MSEALSLLAAVAEHADTLNQEPSAPSRSLRSRVEQSGAANGVASTFCQEAELANMVCGVVENYVKRTVPTIMSPAGHQQGAMVNLELLLQLATLVVGIVRRDAAVAAAVDAASPGQSAASLTSELQLMDVLVKTLNSQDDYPQQQLQPQHSQQAQQPPKQQPSPTAFQLLMQHGSSSCLSSDSTLAVAPAEAAGATAGGQRNKFDLPSSPHQQTSKQPSAAAAALDGPPACLGASASGPLPVSASSNPTDVVGLLKQLYYSNNPSAAAAAMALAAKLAAGASSGTTAAVAAPMLRSLPIAAQGAAAAATGGQVDAQAHEALAALAALQQQHQYLAAPSAAEIMHHQGSSSLERLSLNSSGGASSGASLQHAAALGQSMDPSVLIATLAAAAAAAAAGPVDPSAWSSAMSVAAAAAAGQGGLGLGNQLPLHAGYSSTPPQPAAAAAELDPAAGAAAAVCSVDRGGKADRYREKRAARVSGASGVKSAGASLTGVPAPSAVASAATASQIRRSASYQAALNDLRQVQHATGNSTGGAAPMVE